MAFFSRILPRVPESSAKAPVAAMAMHAAKLQKRSMCASPLQHLLRSGNLLQHLMLRNSPMPPPPPPPPLQALSELVPQRFTRLSPGVRKAPRLLARHPEENPLPPIPALAPPARIPPPPLVPLPQ